MSDDGAKQQKGRGSTPGPDPMAMSRFFCSKEDKNTRFAAYLVQPAADLVFRRPTVRNSVRACSTFRAESFQLGLTKWHV